MLNEHKDITKHCSLIEGWYRLHAIIYIKQLLPGAKVHLRPETELTTRLCFVNFDGTKALKASEEIGLERPLPDDFVRSFCAPTVTAIEVNIMNH